MFFSAAASQSESYIQREVVKFHDTLSDINTYGCGGWDRNTYTLMCPVTGYYLFLVSIRNIGGNNVGGCPVYLWMSQNQEKQRILELYYSNWNDARSSITVTGTANVILPCEGGQTVWVETRRVCSLGGSNYNQFSGFLLKTGLE